MPDKLPPSVPVSEAEARATMRRLSRRSFTVGGMAALLGVGGWSWLRTRELDGGIPWPLRRVLEFNERLGLAYFQPTRLAPNFPRERAREPRTNGHYGLNADFDPARWSLQVEQTGPKPRTQTFSLNDIKALPRVEMVTELKCVEGWSEIVQWAGARLVDFAMAHRFGTFSGEAPDTAKRPEDVLPYVRLDTPGGGYYVGLDAPSAFHPQTLLCYEMNGEPLPLEHGAPLRLVIPHKYGLKNIKRIGTLRFGDSRPADYWTERGYDWYVGL
jgi:DMSO/TMAO reductase YedYZ molybdopterin-dependent catalytic subunit